MLVGRHPHLDFWAWESVDDRAAAQGALAAVDLAGLEQRDIATLSGGERRRLSIATILAQDPGVFLLDEPIHQLDPQHQLDVLRMFRRLADAGRTVIVSLHDIGLAARFADSALLLFGDGRWQLRPVRRGAHRARRSASCTASPCANCAGNTAGRSSLPEPLRRARSVRDRLENSVQHDDARDDQRRAR